MHARTLLRVLFALFIVYTHATPVAPRAEMVRDMESPTLVEVRDWSAGAIKARNGRIYARGFAASQARLLMLTARKSDLELQLQFVNQARAQMANITAALNQRLATLAPGSSEAAQAQTQINAVQALDGQLEAQQRRLDTQHVAVEQEIDAVKKVIDQNIESGFKTSGNGRRA